MTEPPKKDASPRSDGLRHCETNTADSIPNPLPTLCDELTRFSAAIWQPGDIVELRAFTHGRERGAHQLWVLAEALLGEEALAWIRAEQAAGRSVYAGINPRRTVRGATDTEVTLARAVWADLEDTSPDAALRLVRDLDLPAPSIVLVSGGGVHLYWLLEEPLIDLILWRAIQQGLASTLKSDPKVCNPSRVMRLPGTINLKRNKPARLVEVHPERRYPVAEFTANPEQETQEIQGDDDPPVCPAAPGIPVIPAGPVLPASPVSSEALAVFDQYMVTGPRQRRNLLLQIVRDLKFKYEAPSPAPFTAIVREWHRRYAGRMSGEHSEDESVFDFLGFWEGLTVPIYKGIHEKAFAIADREPAPRADAFADPVVRKLASACYHLERMFGGIPFGLSCHVAGQLLGIPHAKADKLLKGLCRAGWIECTEKGKPGHAGSQASRYRFLGTPIA